MFIWSLLLIAVVLATQRKSCLTAKDLWYFNQREPIVVEQIAWWLHRVCLIVWMLAVIDCYLSSIPQQAIGLMLVIPTIELLSMLFGKLIWRTYWRARFCISRFRSKPCEIHGRRGDDPKHHPGFFVTS